MSREDLVRINNEALEDMLTKMKDAPKDSVIFKSNKHLLHGSTNKVWAGGGNLSLGGFIFWSASCNVLLTDVATGVKAIHFSADGTGFMLGASESEVVGAFVVDPSSIKGGNCHFTIVTGAVEAGATTLFLYTTKGKLLGNFTGPSEGFGAGTMSGTGKLKIVSS